jgi:hypothetical protein
MQNWKEVFKDKNRHDFYVVYDLSQHELKKIKDNWYQDGYMLSPSGEIYTDNILTVKVCDEETTSRLYGYVYNPVSINITCPIGAKFVKNDKEELLYNMIVSIKSIDDSSFTIWFEQIPLKTLHYIREELKKYIDLQKYINGDKLISYCESLGANPNSIAYD